MLEYDFIEEMGKCNSCDSEYSYLLLAEHRMQQCELFSLEDQIDQDDYSYLLIFNPKSNKHDHKCSLSDNKRIDKGFILACKHQGF